MVLGKLSVPGRPTNLDYSLRLVGAGGDCLNIFSLVYPISFLPPSLWYRKKYFSKGQPSQIGITTVVTAPANAMV